MPFAIGCDKLGLGLISVPQASLLPFSTKAKVKVVDLYLGDIRQHQIKLEHTTHRISIDDNQVVYPDLVCLAGRHTIPEDCSLVFITVFISVISTTILLAIYHPLPFTRTRDPQVHIINCHAQTQHRTQTDQRALFQQLPLLILGPLESSQSYEYPFAAQSTILESRSREVHDHIMKIRFRQALWSSLHSQKERL